jgi:hypothetical protein
MYVQTLPTNVIAAQKLERFLREIQHILWPYVVANGGRRITIPFPFLPLVVANSSQPIKLRLVVGLHPVLWYIFEKLIITVVSQIVIV